MGKKRKKNDYNIDYEDYLDTPAVSSGDMTGLVQTPPKTDAESESYTDLADVPAPSKQN